MARYRTKTMSVGIQLWRLIALIFLVPQLAGRDAPIIGVRLDPRPRQPIKGWGVTTSFVDSNGNTLKIPAEHDQLIYRDLSATVFRIVIGADTYQDAVDDGTLVPSELSEQVLGPVLRMERFGRKNYVLSILTPPRVMKKYISDKGSIDADPNPLRVEREEDFIRFVVKILTYLQRTGKVLPLAVSFQSEPDWETPDTGCPYSAAQWQRVLAGLRQTMDRAGLSSVALIGPETSNASTVAPFLTLPAEPAQTERFGPPGLGGVALHEGPLEASQREALASFRSLTDQAHRAQLDLWVLDGYFATTRRNRQPVVMQTIKRLGRDLIAFHATYWFWRQGSAPFRESEIAKWDDRISYRFLQRLWSAAPPSSVVRKIEADSTAFKTDDTLEVDLFGFSSEDRIVLVLSNPLLDEQTLGVEGMHSHNYATIVSSASEMSETPLEKPAAGRLLVRLPPRGLVLLVSSRE
jgi:hypothetical protein